jgi:hypothetical protein
VSALYWAAAVVNGIFALVIIAAPTRALTPRDDKETWSKGVGKAFAYVVNFGTVALLVYAAAVLA